MERFFAYCVFLYLLINIYVNYIAESKYKFFAIFLRWRERSILTHEILVIIVIGVMDNSIAISLIISTQSAGVKMFGIDDTATLETRLSQTLVQTFAETASGDFRVELAAQSRISITLERRVRSCSTVGEHMRCRVAVRIFRAAR